jgi:hypothetical protein
MCLICVELSQDKLTALEARRNLSEWVNVIEDEHREELMKAIWKKEDEERDCDLICDYASD